MQKVTLTIRVDSEDLTRWQSKAMQSKENTSQWMRRVLNDACGPHGSVQATHAVGCKCYVCHPPK